MTEPITREQMEQRRMAAAYELRQGQTQTKVAKHFGVSRTTASRWARALAEGRDLKSHKTTGRPTKLHPVQLAEVKRIRSAHPEWTQADIAQWIKRSFGVSYAQDHMGKLLRKLGCSTRRPRPVWMER